MVSINDLIYFYEDEVSDIIKGRPISSLSPVEKEQMKQAMKNRAGQRLAEKTMSDSDERATQAADAKEAADAASKTVLGKMKTALSPSTRPANLTDDQKYGTTNIPGPKSPAPSISMPDHAVRGTSLDAHKPTSSAINDHILAAKLAIQDAKKGIGTLVDKGKKAASDLANDVKDDYQQGITAGHVKNLVNDIKYDKDNSVTPIGRGLKAVENVFTPTVPKPTPTISMPDHAVSGTDLEAPKELPKVEPGTFQKGVNWIQQHAPSGKTAALAAGGAALGAAGAYAAKKMMTQRKLAKR